MRIALLHSRYRQFGGEDCVFEQESALLRRRGHEVFPYVRFNEDIAGAHPVRQLVESVWSAPAYRGIRNVLRRQKVAVGHFHNTFLRISPAGYYAARDEGIPVVQTLHNYRLLCPAANLLRAGIPCEQCVGHKIPWRAVVHGCHARGRCVSAAIAVLNGAHNLARTWTDAVDRYIVLTQYALRKFVEGGLPAEKIRVKPNFVHSDPGEGQGGKYILYAGRLSEEKGISALLKAAAQVARQTEVWIAGSGPMAREVIAASHETPAIKYLASVSRSGIFELMKNAAALVVPSTCYEGFPLVLAEAFATGLPVIASNHGALAELVDPERTGLLFAPADATALAAAMERATRDTALLKRMRRCARQEYLEKYTAQKNYLTLMSIYAELIQRN